MVDREQGSADLALTVVAAAVAAATVDHRPLHPQDHALIRRLLTAVAHRGHLRIAVALRGHLRRDPIGERHSAAQGAIMVVIAGMVIGISLEERETGPAVEAPMRAAQVVEVERKGEIRPRLKGNGRRETTKWARRRKMRRNAKIKAEKKSKCRYRNHPRVLERRTKALPRVLEKRAKVRRMEKTSKIIQKTTAVREYHRDHPRHLLPDHEAPKLVLESQEVHHKEKSVDEKNHLHVLYPPVLVLPNQFNLDNDQTTKEDLDPRLSLQEVQFGHHEVDLLLAEAVLVRETRLDLDRARQ